MASDVGKVGGEGEKSYTPEQLQQATWNARLIKVQSITDDRKVNAILEKLKSKEIDYLTLSIFSTKVLKELSMRLSPDQVQEYKEILEKTLEVVKPTKQAALQLALDRLNLGSDLVSEKKQTLFEAGNVKTWTEAVVNSTPAKDKERVSGQISKLLDGVDDVHQQRAILYVLMVIPPEERADVVAHAAPLLDGSDKARILSEVASIPKDKRAGAATLLNVLSDVPSKLNLLSILTAISKKEDRGRVIENITEMLKVISDSNSKQCLLIFVMKIPATEIVDVIDKASPLLKGIKDDHMIPARIKSDLMIEILDALARIPKDERAEVIHDAAPLLNESNYTRGVILSVAAAISAKKRGEVIRLVSPALNKIKSENMRYIIFSAIKNIPTIQILDVLEKITKLVNTESRFLVWYVIEGASKIPVEQIPQFLEKMNQLYEVIVEHEDREELTSAVIGTPTELVIGVVEMMTEVFKVIDYKENSKKIFNLFTRVLTSQDETKKVEFITQIARLVEGTSDLGERKEAILKYADRFE